MVRKKVDARVRSLIENGVKTKHRSSFVLVGDHGKDQVANLHYILSKARVASRPSVLWCYKKELGFSTHRKKRMRQLKRQKKAGLASAGGAVEDPFELFVNSTTIRWCYYKDTERILGQTFGVLVLQDFEALTPNLLARTIETVEGGGLVIFLLKTVTSLKQLYTMAMDVHSRFRTESSGDVVARFNERFMLTLGDCKSCLVCDDELNVLPLSSHARDIVPLPPVDEEAETKDAKELRELKESLEDTPPVGPLVSGAKTLDQARALLTFMEAISEKTLRSTVALTASRGRGKSAAIGLCLAGAVAYGYSNIFVTAPSPENLSTVFEFVLKGFDLLHFSQHLDYEVIQSTNPAFNRAVVRVNVFKDHRQTIQYIQPHDSEKLSHCELLAIDEAAAIPLPLVKKLLGPYLVFLSSTVNGYEGTGRALSLKLIDQLRRQQGSAAAEAAAIAASEVHGSGRKKGREKVHENRWKVAADAAANASRHGGGGGGSARTLREISLKTPIRYGVNDPVEAWLYRLLCLDTKAGHHRLVCGTPAPKDCELFYVDKDALFSHHALSESFLQRVMSLYTSAHYKNQPNDLQMLSDAPAHHLFVLLGPKAMDQGEKGHLPDVLVVVQVALEGRISRASLEASMSRGHRASGDLIPWSLSQQYQDGQFASLSGARIVRIATHTDVQKMGYGSRAIELLTRYYEGVLFSGTAGGGEGSEESSQESSEEEEEEEEGEERDGVNGATDATDDVQSPRKHSTLALASEKLKPRKKLPPLLVPVGERPPERLHWIGASFGVTGQLLRLWKRAGFRLVYLRQTTSELTGEHTGIMLRALETEGMEEAPQNGWLEAFAADCRRRLVNLLGHQFQGFDCTTALSVLEAAPGAAATAKAESGDSENDISSPSKKAGGVSTGGGGGAASGPLGATELSYYCGPHDLKRLELYSRNLVDYHLITDLLPTLSKLYFLGRMPSTRMSHLHEAILLAMGLQHRSVTALSKELQLPDNQILAIFNKAVRKLGKHLAEVSERAVESEMETRESKQKRLETAKSAGEMSMLPASMKDDLERGAEEAMAGLKGRKEALLESIDLAQYAVKGSEAEWQSATKGANVGSVSIKSKARPSEGATGADDADDGANGSEKKPKKLKKRKSGEAGAGGAIGVKGQTKTAKKKKTKDI